MKSKILGLIILIFSISLFAEERAFFDFERQLNFPEGSKYAGEPVDLSRTRNLIELTDEEIIKSGLHKRHADIDREAFFYVANFRYDKQYWIAKIPKDGVEKSIFQFQQLQTSNKNKVIAALIDYVAAGHVQVRFVMKRDKAIELRPQKLDQQNKPGAFVWDFSYSLHSGFSQLQDKKFSAFGDGLKGGYVVTHNFVATVDMAYKMSRMGLDAKQYVMNFSPEQSDALLAHYVEKSIGLKENEITYHTFKRSCVTNAMEGIYSIVYNKPVAWFPRIWRLWRVYYQAKGTKFEYNPRVVVSQMKKQDIILEDSQLPSLQDEFSNLCQMMLKNK